MDDESDDHGCILPSTCTENGNRALMFRMWHELYREAELDIGGPHLAGTAAEVALAMHKQLYGVDRVGCLYGNRKHGDNQACSALLLTPFLERGSWNTLSAIGVTARQGADSVKGRHC